MEDLIAWTSIFVIFILFNIIVRSMKIKYIVYMFGVVLLLGIQIMVSLDSYLYWWHVDQISGVDNNDSVLTKTDVDALLDSLASGVTHENASEYYFEYCMDEVKDFNGVEVADYGVVAEGYSYEQGYGQMFDIFVLLNDKEYTLSFENTYARVWRLAYVYESWLVD